jgi:hypothetical protein
MRGFVIFVALLIFALVTYQIVAPELAKRGIDMNVTSAVDTDVEVH